MEVVADLHLNPYYGDEDETEASYSSQVKRRTTTFHAYAMLYTRVRNKRYTLAVRQPVAGDTTNDVFVEFLELLNGLNAEVKAIDLDRGFYNNTCLGLLNAYKYVYFMPISNGMRRFKTTSVMGGAARSKRRVSGVHRHTTQWANPL